MKVLVCGSRTWTDKAKVYEVLRALKSEITLVIDGAARRADEIGHGCAVALGLPTQRFSADWEKYGKSAGYRRNLEMLDQCPDLVARLLAW